MPNAVRPYAMVVAGRPVSMQWDPFSKTKTFILIFDAGKDDTRSNSTIVFVPEIHYNNNGTALQLWASDEGKLTHDRARQVVEYRHTRREMPNRVEDSHRDMEQQRQAADQRRATAQRKVLKISIPTL